MQKLDPDVNRQLVSIKNQLVDSFNESNWLELGMLTNYAEEVQNNPKLLRSYRFGDDDYEMLALANVKTAVKNVGQLSKAPPFGRTSPHARALQVGDWPVRRSDSSSADKVLMRNKPCSSSQTLVRPAPLAVVLDIRQQPFLKHACRLA